MKTIWLLYILISFNGDPQLEIHEYVTEQECEQEKARVIQEVKEVYDIEDVQVHCILSARDLK
jgi:hypothetical protein